MIPNVDELLKILKESENDMKYNRVAPISTTWEYPKVCVNLQTDVR